jgi:hypothetical protein
MPDDYSLTTTFCHQYIDPGSRRGKGCRRVGEQWVPGCREVPDAT